MITVRGDHKRKEFFVGHTSPPQRQIARVLLVVLCLRSYWGIVGLQDARG